jgi:outer membrane protein TolC
MKIDFKYFMIIGLLSIISEINAQQRMHISLSDALKVAEQNNTEIRLAELDHKISDATYRQTDATFLPQVTMGLNFMSTNNPLNAFGFLLQQSQVTSMAFDPAKLNSPGARQNYNSSIDVRLPLINLDMFYARKGAKLQEESYKYKALYTKDYISFEIRKIYIQLQFAYISEGILKSTLEDVKQIHQSVTNFYNKGMVQQSDVLNAQVQINTIESALEKSKNSISNASEGLAFFMGDTISEKVYVPDSLLQYRGRSFIGTIPLERSDVVAMHKAVDASDMMVKSSRMNFLPKLNAWGSYQYNDSKVFRFNNDSYMLGISLSWNIFTGNQNRYKLKTAILQRDKYQKEMSQYLDKSRLEINKNQREIQNLMFEIQKNNASVAQSSEAFRIMNNRFKEGLTSTTDLLMSQAQLYQQRLLLAQSIMNFNIAQSYQEFLTNIK